MTIAEDLNKILTIKNNIKDVIESKGFSLDGIPFEQYPAKILEILNSNNKSTYSVDTE